MSRIRSVHPGLFTDEVFFSLSPIARVLLIGIWTECDDHGAFEWKPGRLKVRILPADHVDVGDLLTELAAADAVKKYTHDGREYGLVRNFCRFQRPRKPKYFAFIPPELRTYVALSDSCTVLDDDEEDSVPTKSVMSPQKEGREEGRKKDPLQEEGSNSGGRGLTPVRVVGGRQ